MSVFEANDLRVLVCAPTRRDGEVTRELLGQRGIECVVCLTVQEVTDRLPSGMGVVVLTDAVIADQATAGLVAEIQKQPPWSDLPVLMLTREKGVSPSFMKSFGALTNVTLLDRPSSTQSLVSAVQAALRARRRQYEIRDQIVTLRQAEQALREADRRKDEFLATLAHELRNPLAAIRTGMELMSRSAAESQRTRVVGMIDRQSRTLVKLIDDLMDVSRIATGKVALAKERLDLRSVLESGVEGTQALLDASRHQFSLELPAHSIWVDGDPSRLAQVVNNLVTNASKYTPDGGRITVSIEEEELQAVIRVRDSGVGIPAELLNEVFEMFTQVNRSMDRSRGGLGIGLSLVRNLVALHGGTVEARSDGVDLGSTFIVRLPLSSASTGSAVPAAASTSDQAAPLEILVVDDNQDAADGLAALLELDGHRARTAYDGASGLQAAQALVPDLIFCDIGMPGMTGHELAARIRSTPQGRSPLLVAVTGWGTEDDRRRSDSAGFDLHITKPISAEQIESALLAAERSRNARRPVR